MIRVLLLVIGYCLGMIQTGYLYGRMKGIDIRKAGSGNSAATLQHKKYTALPTISTVTMKKNCHLIHWLTNFF